MTEGYNAGAGRCWKANRHGYGGFFAFKWLIVNMIMQEKPPWSWRFLLLEEWK